jgi:endoglucanase
MQTAEGGVRGGIESAEHPRFGEGSWQESLPVMAYAPGIWSSYRYAGVAARASGLLERLRPRLAPVYRESAIRAMEWAEARLPEELRGVKDEGPEKMTKRARQAVRDARNLAAAELFRLTGDARWHDVFLASTVYHDPEQELSKWQVHDQRHAPWVYVRTEREGRDREVRESCLRAIVKYADMAAEGCAKTGFRWTKGNPWRPIGWGVLGAPQAGVELLRAHALTDDAKYLRAAVLTCQVGLGANPVNVTYTTGVGRDWPRNPLWIDSRMLGVQPPPGLTVYGPMDTKKNKDYWLYREMARVIEPAHPEWPTMEAYFDVFLFPAVTEFTVMQTMGPTTYVWGYLAARPVSGETR